MFKSMILAAVALSWAHPAFADMTAHYVIDGDQSIMTMEIAANGDVRARFGSDASYFLTRAGQSYYVKAGPDGPLVMRQEDIAAVMLEQLAAEPNPPSPDPHAKDVRLVARGAVSIRGRKGVAYMVNDKHARGPDDPPFLVVSDDPALTPLAVAVRMQFSASLGPIRILYGDAGGWDDMVALFARGAPLLFLGMELGRIDPARLPASRFVLPASPLSREAVRRDFTASR